MRLRNAKWATCSLLWLILSHTYKEVQIFQVDFFSFRCNHITALKQAHIWTPQLNKGSKWDKGIYTLLIYGFYLAL